MTRIINAKAIDATGGTTTSGSEASPENKLRCTFNAGDQEASTQYMIWAFYKIGSNGATSDNGIRLRNSTAGTTYMTDKVEQQDASDTRTGMMLGLYTSAGTPVTQNFDLDVWSESGDTVTYSDLAIFVVEVDATDGIGESTGDTVVDASPSADKPSVSFTADGNGEIILYAIEMITADTDFPPCLVVVDVDGSDVTGSDRRYKTKDVTTNKVIHAAFPTTMASGARDVDLEIVGVGGSIDNITFRNARMFVMRRSTFEAVYSAFNTTRRTNDVNDTFSTPTGASLTQTLAAAEHIVIGSCKFDGSATTQSSLIKFREDAGSGFVDIVEVSQEPSATTDDYPFTIGYFLDSAAAEYDFDFQHAPESTSVVGSDGHAIIVIQMEATAGAYTLTADAGSYAVTGTAASLERNRLIGAATAAYNVTGTAASLERGFLISAATAAYTVTGQDADFDYARAIIGGAGVYNVVGAAAALERALRLVADAGAYAVSGTNATLSPGKAIAAAGGGYVVTGQDAGLLRALLLAAAAGSYAVNGVAASLERALEVLAASGSYAVTGGDADLIQDMLVAALAGAYAITGQDSAFSKDSVISAGGGSYIVNGVDVTLLADKLIQAGAGLYTITGNDANLIHTQLQAVGEFIIRARRRGRR